MSRSLRSEDSIRSQSTSSGKQKVIIIILSVILAIVLLAGGVYFLKIYVLDKLKSGNKTTICRTDDCLEAAEYFKTTMNLSADPCNDFFSYACGGWVQKYKHLTGTVYNRVSVSIIEENVILSKLKELLSSNEDSSSNAVNKVKSFFQKCVNRKPSKEFAGIRRVVKDFGGFPMFDERTYDKQIPWYVRSAKVMRQFGKLTDENDVWNGIIINVRINNEKLFLTHPISYFVISNFNSFNSYVETVKTSVCNILKKSCTKKEFEKMSEQVIKMVQFRAKIDQYIKEHNHDTLGLHYTVQTFHDEFPELHGYDFLKELSKNSGAHIDNDTVIYVTERDYWGNISRFIRETDPETIDNLIGWSTFEMLKYTDSPKTTLSAYKYLNADEMDSVSKDIENQCYEMTQHIFPLVISRLYVDKYFNDSLIYKAKILIKDMKKALIELINETDWLSTIVKTEAIRKVELMGDSDVGYPSWLKLDTKLDQYYYMKEPLPDSSVIELYRTAFSYHMHEKLSLLECPSYKDHAWDTMFPHTENARNDRTNNMILVPATRLNTPIFFPGTKALTYATQAVSIGHELTHAIDSFGALYDAYGYEREWWDEKSKIAFDQRVQCVIDQFNEILDPQINMHLNGQATNTENTADYGGWRLAYRAYLNSGPKDERLPGLEELGDKKLFFIGAGLLFCSEFEEYMVKLFVNTEVHSPDKYRVYMPSANMEEFSKAFNCPLGSKMNPKKKCIVW